METPKTSKFVLKKDFSWEQKVAALGDRKDLHLGARRCRTRIFGDKFKGIWGFLDPCNQNETYHTSNEDKIEHMNETC